MGIPRAFVVAALRETVKHPDLHTLPILQRARAEHHRAWDAFRVVEAEWMLTHATLIGAVRAEGRDLWESVRATHTEAERMVQIARDQQCLIPLGNHCSVADARLQSAMSTAVAAEKSVRAWERLLEIERDLTLQEVWGFVFGRPINEITPFTDAFVFLHNVSHPSDPRIQELMQRADRIAAGFAVTEHTWYQQLAYSLLMRDLWAICLQYIQQREKRIHEMMVSAGIQDLFETHARIQTAAAAAATVADTATVQLWFDTAAAYAWWLPEEIPSIVQRCIRNSNGECRRIGPTEIASLMAQYDERERIRKDWSRRLFIGMWNAIPAVTLLFVLEVTVLCIPIRRPLRRRLRSEQRATIQDNDR